MYSDHFQARVEDVVQDLEPLQITTILWSVAKLDHHPGIELMEALLSAINLNIAGFAPQVRKSCPVLLLDNQSLQHPNFSKEGSAPCNK